MAEPSIGNQLNTNKKEKNMLPFEIKSGTYTGDGTSQTITLGFKPMLVIVYNETEGDVVSIKYGESAANTHIAISTATAAVSSGGMLFTSTGFKVGTDSSASESAKTFRYVAIGSQSLAADGS